MAILLLFIYSLDGEKGLVQFAKLLKYHQGMRDNIRYNMRASMKIRLFNLFRGATVASLYVNKEYKFERYKNSIYLLAFRLEQGSIKLKICYLDRPS